MSLSEPRPRNGIVSALILSAALPATASADPLELVNPAPIVGVANPGMQNPARQQAQAIEVRNAAEIMNWLKSNNAGAGLFYTGDIGMSSSSLNELAQWLSKNSPHSVVYLANNMNRERFQGHEGFDAVDVYFNTELPKTKWSAQTHAKVAEGDGTFFILSLNITGPYSIDAVRNGLSDFSFRTWNAFSARGLDDARYESSTKDHVRRAKWDEGGDWAGAVRGILAQANADLDRKISDEIAQAARIESRARGAVEAATLEFGLLGEKLAEFRKSYPNATGDLAFPKLEAIEGKLAEAKTGIDNKSFGVAESAATAVRGGLKPFFAALDEYPRAGESLALLARKITTARAADFSSLVANDLTAGETAVNVAKVEWERGNTTYVEKLRTAEQAVRAGQEKLDGIKTGYLEDGRTIQRLDDKLTKLHGARHAEEAREQLSDGDKYLVRAREGHAKKADLSYRGDLDQANAAVTKADEIISSAATAEMVKWGSILGSLLLAGGLFGFLGKRAGDRKSKARGELKTENDALNEYDTSRRTFRSQAKELFGDDDSISDVILQGTSKQRAGAVFAKMDVFDRHIARIGSHLTAASKDFGDGGGVSLSTKKANACLTKLRAPVDMVSIAPNDVGTQTMPLGDLKTICTKLKEEIKAELDAFANAKKKLPGLLQERRAMIDEIKNAWTTSKQAIPQSDFERISPLEANLVAEFERDQTDYEKSAPWDPFGTITLLEGTQERLGTTKQLAESLEAAKKLEEKIAEARNTIAKRLGLSSPAEALNEEGLAPVSFVASARFLQGASVSALVGNSAEDIDNNLQRISQQLSSGQECIDRSLKALENYDTAIAAAEGRFTKSTNAKQGQQASLDLLKDKYDSSVLVLSAAEILDPAGDNTLSNNIEEATEALAQARAALNKAKELHAKGHVCEGSFEIERGNKFIDIAEHRYSEIADRKEKVLKLVALNANDVTALSNEMLTALSDAKANTEAPDEALLHSTIETLRGLPERFEAVAKLNAAAKPNPLTVSQELQAFRVLLTEAKAQVAKDRANKAEAARSITAAEQAIKNALGVVDRVLADRFAENKAMNDAIGTIRALEKSMPGVASRIKTPHQDWRPIDREADEHLERANAASAVLVQQTEQARRAAEAYQSMVAAQDDANNWRGGYGVRNLNGLPSEQTLRELQSARSAANFAMIIAMAAQIQNMYRSAIEDGNRRVRAAKPPPPPPPSYSRPSSGGVGSWGGGGRSIGGGGGGGYGSTRGRV